jgi:predicted MPP superfamily phosphohydrolase
MVDRGRPRVSLTYEQIQHEILVKKLDIAQIAKKYHISDDTVRRRMKEGAKASKKSKASKQKASKDKTPEPPKLTLEQRAMLAENSKKYNPDATKHDCIEDLRRIKGLNPNQFITRNFYRIHGKYSEKTWNRYFGTMEEFRSQAGLQLSRTQRHLEKHIAKHAALDESRKFFRLEVEPWVGKYAKYDQYQPDGTMKKILLAADFHDIDTDLFVLEVFLDTCRIEQPDIIALVGDVFDQYEFSHFDRDPRKINLKARMEFVRERIFKRLRKACPNAQIDFLIGNHEHRLLKHMASRTENMAALMEMMGIGLAQMLGLDAYQINLVSKGNTTAFLVKEIKEEMAKNWKVYFNTLVANHEGYEDFGLSTVSAHTHRPKMDTEVHLLKGPINKVVIGPMCKLDADYTKTKTNWQNSFAIAYVDPVHERVQIDHVLFTEPFVNVNGRFYYRNMDSAEIRGSEQVIAAIKTKEIQGFVHMDCEAAIVAGLDIATAAGAI